MSFFLLLVTLAILGVLVAGMIATYASPIAVFKAGIKFIKAKIRWTP